MSSTHEQIWEPECPACQRPLDPDKGEAGCELCASWHGWYPTKREPLERVTELATLVYRHWSHETFEWATRASLEAAEWGLRRLGLNPHHYHVIRSGSRIEVVPRDAVSILGELA